MIDRTAVATLDTFEAADRADREERWAMTPQERLAAMELLRRVRYPDGRTAPRLERVLESVEFSPT